MKRWILSFIIILMLPFSARAQATTSKGEGAIITEDNVTIYKDADRDTEVYKLNRGDAVAARPGNISLFVAPNYRFEPVNGRYRINFFPREAGQTDRLVMGWVDPKYLSVFYFQCCDPAGKSCGPMDLKGLTKATWTSCFREARDHQITQLASAQKAGGPAKTVEIGNTEEQVRSALGEPSKVLKLTDKVIWIYSDVKVTFRAGKVSDMQ
jgi:hypothetical protein